jgi:hypothetical protein
VKLARSLPVVALKHARANGEAKRYFLHASFLTMLSMIAAMPCAAASFGDDVAFLKKHTKIIVLGDGAAQVAIAPEWQGRVMTSTAADRQGASFGWTNRALIESGNIDPHFNPFGGEDRIWLGPEGGQYSVFFAKDAPFDLEHWYVPKAFDTLPFQTVIVSKDHAAFRAKFGLANYSGTHFDVILDREVRLLSPANAWKQLGLPVERGLSLVAFETRNTLTNAGPIAWQKSSGLLSIWILGMFTPSSAATTVVPIKSGPDDQLGVSVTSDYFGAIPPDRLKVTNDAVFLRADGKFRSKIGINPKRSTGVLGNYDAAKHVLTIVQTDLPGDTTDYVNSLWKLQDNPYDGDALNAYNDGPPAAGVKPMGPFFEMETSSPAAALAPQQSIAHIHRTFHLVGSEADLDAVSRAVLGVPLSDIAGAFAGSGDAQ